MTQKSNLFKGQQKRKTIPPNRHGKVAHTRKGKRFVKPSKSTSEMDTDREVTKFISHCNEMKAATCHVPKELFWDVSSGIRAGYCLPDVWTLHGLVGPSGEPIRDGGVTRLGGGECNVQKVPHRLGRGPKSSTYILGCPPLNKSSFGT